MMINLWNNLVAQSGFTPLTTGTWSFEGGPTTIQPPSTYNQSISFTGALTGTYEYQYLVTNGLCTSKASVFVLWTNTGLRANDECAGRLLLPIPSSYTNAANMGIIQFDNLTFAGQCPNFAPATVSASPPAQWGATPVRDLWYRIVPPAHIDNYQLDITISGQNYGQQGVVSPRIATYTSCNTLQEAAIPLSGQTSTISQTINVSSLPTEIIIRVGCIATSAPNFSLIISL